MILPFGIRVKEPALNDLINVEGHLDRAVLQQ
jgi:hypothetical protein